MKDNNNIKHEYLGPFEPIIEEDFSYESIVQNPILKPLSELDKFNYDLEDMINKKLSDIKRDKQYVDSNYNSITAYSESPFCSTQQRLFVDIQDLLKLQDIKNRRLIEAIVDIVKRKYILLEKSASNQIDYDSHSNESDEKIEEGNFEINYKGYLQKLTRSANEVLKKCSRQILALYVENRTNKPNKEKFEMACAHYFQIADENEKKIIPFITQLKAHYI